MSDTNYLIAASRPWYKAFAERLQKKCSANFFLISEKEKLSAPFLAEIRPKMIFFPHWSWIIPEDIWGSYECVVFHMTDLPFGRGGSPLQNLIEREIYETVISALRCDGGLDTGDIYIKRPLSLRFGNAEEIFLQAADIVEEMIAYIIENSPVPTPQMGDVVTFKRRTEGQSRIQNVRSLHHLYDHIRMLDAEGYPRAFLEIDGVRFEFSRVSMKHDSLEATVKISDGRQQ